MLWFLSLAADGGYVIDSYTDAAEGRMARFADGREGVTEIVLRPQVVVAGGRMPEDGAIEALHHAAHERCAIAHSIRGEVHVQGSWRPAAGAA